MFQITVDLTGVQQAAAAAGDESTLQAALQASLQYVQAAWIAAVSGAQVPGMSRPVHDDAYAAALSTPAALEYPFNSDPFQGRVLMTDPRLAQRYEEGYKAFDIKPGLLRGKSAKTAKDGHRYAIVPFTHSTPGSAGQKGAPMPDAVYAVAATAQQGGRVPLPPQLAALGLQTKPQVGGMTGAYTWKSGPYQGMVRGGRGGHTTYATFRVVSERSNPNSWWHPGQPANPIVASVAALVEAPVQAAIRRALGEPGA